MTGVLDGLSRTGRFCINLSLLSQAEQKACEELFNKLKVAAGGCHPSKDDNSNTSIVCEASLTHVEGNESDITTKLKVLAGKYDTEK